MLSGARAPLAPLTRTFSKQYRAGLREGWSAVLAALPPGTSLRDLKERPRWTDRALRRAVLELHNENPRGRQQGVLAALAVQKRCRLDRRDLPRAWEALWEWRIQRPPSLRVPLPPTLLRAVVVVGSALALAVGYPTLRRPSEMCGSRRGDVAMPSQRLVVGGRAVVPGASRLPGEVLASIAAAETLFPQLRPPAFPASTLWGVPGPFGSPP